MNTYEHAFTLTSQLYFCSSPLRLDTYNKCQYGCTYCFSRNRQSDITDRTTSKANHNALEKRLSRIFNGVINSALDEFLERRVPVQFGGLFDPFTQIESTEKESLRIMHILNEFQYPTLISTKGCIFTKKEYIDVLKKMNVVVRISAAGISEKYRSNVDIGCDSFKKVLSKIRFLSEMNIPVTLRIQPVIPGFEKNALIMTEQAADAGALQVSYEYLKICSENRSQELNDISKAIGKNIGDVMQKLGMLTVGRDYTLNKSMKCEFLLSAKKLCTKLSIKFGAGDTEFIHLSDGIGCCSCSEFFIKGANQFRTNFVGVLSRKQKSFDVNFNDLFKEWTPKHNIHRYLTTNSRSRDIKNNYPSLLALLSYRWNGGKGPYSPAFFYGVNWNGEYDNNGYKIYKFVNPF